MLDAKPYSHLLSSGSIIRQFCGFVRPYYCFSLCHRLIGAQVGTSQNPHAAVDGAGTSKMLPAHVWSLGKESWELDSVGLMAWSRAPTV